MNKIREERKGKMEFQFDLLDIEYKYDEQLRLYNLKWETKMQYGAIKKMERTYMGYFESEKKNHFHLNN